MLSSSISPPASRRGVLKGILAGAVAVAPAVAEAKAATDEGMSARERVDWLLAELKVALREANPRARVSDIYNGLDDENSPLPLMVMVQWATGKYEGDGIYCGGSEHGRKRRYEVVALNQPVKGERGFSVIEVGEKKRQMWMELSESALEAFIGVRIGPLGEGASS